MLFELLTAIVAVSGAPADTVPLYSNLGDYHREITTSEPMTQQYFDQGLRLVYAFNHAEAIRAFDEAARLDPNCAMCYWGAALAYGPNINAPMDSTAGVAAYEAIQAAVARKAHASKVERELIDALAVRYSATPTDDRERLDLAYAREMVAVADRNRDDPDVLTFAAESRMMLRPWDYWAADGTPHPGTEQLLNTLEMAIGLDSDHPGACHFYIHAVEAAHPERAVDCAEKLANLMPGAGHLVHMPAHIYIRVGRYGDAVDANVHAVHADEEYIEDQSPDGMYPQAYYPHNYHFMAFAAMMAGRGDRAISAARSVTAKVAPEIAGEVYFLENAPAYAHLALSTFGRWEELLAEPGPPPGLPTAAGLVEYTRGVAFAATGQPAKAREALERLETFNTERMAGADTPAKQILPIAIHALQGEIALRGGDPEAAVTHFEAARDLEDQLLYDEPPLWHYPIRQSLGRALIEAGRPVDAEAAYREDLKRFPENGWSLFGLVQCLEAQGKDAEAALARERFDEAWSSADVVLTASRF